MVVASRIQISGKHFSVVVVGGILLFTLTAMLLSGTGPSETPSRPSTVLADPAITPSTTDRPEAPPPQNATATSVIETDQRPAPAAAVELVEDSSISDEPDADPYEISEFIDEPIDDGKVHSNTDAPRTAAEDEDEAEAESARETPAPETSSTATDAIGVEGDGPGVTRSAEIASPRAPYSAGCPAGNSAVSPVHWLSLSAEQRRAFPRPTLNIASYSSKPQRRFVMVGRQIVHEGQLLPSGVALLRIQPKTLVLSSAGCAVEIPTRLTLR